MNILAIGVRPDDTDDIDDIEFYTDDTDDTEFYTDDIKLGCGGF